MEEIITSGLREMGLEGRVPDDAPSRLARYGRLLLEKNQVMNLTAIREADQVARLHMLDCAALLLCADLHGKRLIDVGTGAGFPGLVLKILVPDLEVTLLDSLNKRLDWLEEVASALSLSGVRTIHGRAEELSALPDWRESFDAATARAVADLRALSELCLPFVRVGGVPLLTTPSQEPIFPIASSWWKRPPPPPRATPAAGPKFKKPPSKTRKTAQIFLYFAQKPFECLVFL